MSNLSDIGFPVRSEQDVNEMIIQVVNHTEKIPCERGFYLRFSDESGAEIYLQGNFDQEMLGFNPHFNGKSKRSVGITTLIERDASELDGGFYAWANPRQENGEYAGDYPFVFDTPDFRTIPDMKIPQTVEIQLTAFASNDFEMFLNEQEYDESQSDSIKYASKSFVPGGLFEIVDEEIDLSVLRPIATLSGEITEFELKTNTLTGEKFYWLLVDSFGGEIDVVADPKLFPNEPTIGGIVKGQFWLSGRITSAPETKSKLFKNFIDV